MDGAIENRTGRDLLRTQGMQVEARFKQSAPQARLTDPTHLIPKKILVSPQADPL